MPNRFGLGPLRTEIHPGGERALDRVRDQQRQVVAGFLWALLTIVCVAMVVSAALLGRAYAQPGILLPNAVVLAFVTGTIWLNRLGRTRLAVSLAAGLVMVSASIPPLTVGIEGSGPALMLFFIPMVVAGLLIDRFALAVTTAWALVVVVLSALLHGAQLTGGGETDASWIMALQFVLVLVVLAVLLDRFGLRHQQTLRDALAVQVEAEAELLAEKGFSDAIIESLPGLFFVRDLSGRYVRWNGRFQEASGYSADELAALEPLELFEGPDKDLVAQGIRQVFEDGYASADAYLVSRSGERQPYFFSATRIERYGETYLVGCGIDRSEVDRARSRIESLNLALQERVERLTALREIDRAIIGSVDLDLTLGVMLDQVTSRLKVPAARILLFDQSDQGLRFGASQGLPARSSRGPRLGVGHGPAGTVARDRIRLELSGEDAVTALRDGASAEVDGLAAYVGVPLMAKGQLQGVLEVFSFDELPESDDWHDFLDALAMQVAIGLSNARLFDELERSNVVLRLAYDTTIEGWARALDLKDQETEGHSRRVTEMAVQLAARLGLKGEDLVHVRRGALLHDIGKMGVPDTILLKPGKLDEEEWEVMKSHTTLAYQLLSGIPFLKPALDIPHAHHERWDGRGYPRGLKGEEIPLSARLFAVVDVFDALTSDRPYRPAWPRARAVEHIRSSAGTQFDPVAVGAFLEMLEGEPAEAARRERGR